MTKIERIATVPAIALGFAAYFVFPSRWVGLAIILAVSLAMVGRAFCDREICAAVGLICHVFTVLLVERHLFLAMMFFVVGYRLLGDRPASRRKSLAAGHLALNPGQGEVRLDRDRPADPAVHDLCLRIARRCVDSVAPQARREEAPDALSEFYRAALTEIEKPAVLHQE